MRRVSFLLGAFCLLSGSGHLSAVEITEVKENTERAVVPYDPKVGGHVEPYRGSSTQGRGAERFRSAAHQAHQQYRASYHEINVVKSKRLWSPKFRSHRRTILQYQYNWNDAIKAWENSGKSTERPDLKTFKGYIESCSSSQRVEILRHAEKNHRGYNLFLSNILSVMQPGEIQKARTEGRRQRWTAQRKRFTGAVRKHAKRAHDWSREKYDQAREQFGR